MLSGKATGCSSLLLPLSVTLTSKRRLDIGLVEEGATQLGRLVAKLATFFSKEVQRLSMLSVCAHVPDLCLSQAGTRGLSPSSCLSRLPLSS